MIGGSTAVSPGEEMGDQPLTIIAEAAQGYEGKPLLGELLIRGAAAAGAEAIKFQIVFADDVAVPGYQHYAFYQQLEMAEPVWAALKEAAHHYRLSFYADLSGERALQLARRIMPDAVKIHSGNFFNHRLVDQILEAFPRVLVSTGGIHLEEIEGFICRHRLQPGASKVAFLFGFQADPTPVGQNNLARVPGWMDRLSGFEVGFMDHSDGDGPDDIHVSVMALALGVRLFEKHLTLDRALRLEDYASGLEPARFAEYVGTLRRLKATLGSPEPQLNEAELAYRNKMVKKVIPVRDLPQGHVVTEADVVQKRRDVAGDRFCYDPDRVLGRRLAKPIAVGEPFRQEDLG